MHDALCVEWRFCSAGFFAAEVALRTKISGSSRLQCSLKLMRQLHLCKEPIRHASCHMAVDLVISTKKRAVRCVREVVSHVHLSVLQYRLVPA